MDDRLEEDWLTHVSRRVARTFVRDSKGMTLCAIAWDRRDRLLWRLYVVVVHRWHREPDHCAASWSRETQRYWILVESSRSQNSVTNDCEMLAPPRSNK